jgi:MoxR-like ATPase
MKDSINLRIFAALKMSEKSGVPVLLLANPGAGKSSSVFYFAQVRGYELCMLRGNSSSPEEIMGYDSVNTSNLVSTVHLRPAWFQRLLDNQEKGKKTLLFLDELSTASSFVQAALLHLVFERKVGEEKIPDDTLIVAAGNYAANLDNTMTLIAPILNRFAIVNIIPSAEDIPTFMSRYDGSIVDGKRKDFFKELVKDMKALDAQELHLDEETENKIGDYIERTVRMTAGALAKKGPNQKINLAVSELKDMYADLEGDQPLAGFVSFRTLNYLVDFGKAAYLCFGKSGLTSDTFKDIVRGLCGIGVTRDSKGEVKFNDVTNDFFSQFKNVVNEIEKMNNSKLPQYEKYFKTIIKDKKKFEIEDLNGITNKIKELRADREISNIERPVDSDVVAKMCEIMVASGKKFSAISMPKNTNVLDQIPVETFNGYATYWGFLADTMSELRNLVKDSSKGYKEDTTEKINETVDDLHRAGLKLKSVRKMITIQDPSIGSVIPEIKSFE